MVLLGFVCCWTVSWPGVVTSWSLHWTPSTRRHARFSSTSLEKIRFPRKTKTVTKRTRESEISWLLVCRTDQAPKAKRACISHYVVQKPRLLYSCNPVNTHFLQSPRLETYVTSSLVQESPGDNVRASFIIFWLFKAPPEPQMTLHNYFHRLSIMKIKKNNKVSSLLWLNWFVFERKISCSRWISA